MRTYPIIITKSKQLSKIDKDIGFTYLLYGTLERL
jgi:hypothetical protein